VLTKSHKLAGNGLDAYTTLPVSELNDLALIAAQESTGDLVFGMQRISLTRSSDQHMEFRVNDFVLAYKKLLVFSLDFTTHAKRTEVTSKIDWYLTERQNVGFLPFGAKQMIGHSTYLQFIHGLAEKVRAADPAAEITIREGDQPQQVHTAAQAVPEKPVPEKPVPAKPTPSFAPVAPYLREDAPSYSPVTPAEPAADDQSTDMSGMPERWPEPVELSSGRLYFGDLSERSAGKVPAAEGAVTVESLPDPSFEDLFAASAPSAGDPDELEPVAAAHIERAHFGEEHVDEAEVDEAEVEETETDNENAKVLAFPLDPQRRETEPTWVLTMANGTVLAIDHALVLGRNPQLPPGMPGAEAVVVVDPERSVSKTHAIVEARDGDLWVTDLASTNGTRMGFTPGEWIRCEPGVATKIERRCQLRFGKYRLHASIRR
jgi:hypothetical protein